MNIKLVFPFLISAQLLFSQQQDSTYHFYFHTGAHTQNSDSIQKFMRFYEGFKNCNTCLITLEGHTDKVGSATSNYILAKKRTVFVQSLLQDLSKDKIKTFVIGEEKAQTETENQAYRMVKLVIYSPPKIQEKPIIKEVLKDEKTTKTEPLPTSTATTKSRMEDFSARDKAIQLKILFYPGSTDLIRSSFADLELLFNYLSENKQIKAKIVGHVCCSPEMKLSKQRAEIVYDYLVKKGIDKKRLTYTGVSNTQPLVEEINEDTQKMNRRVEVFFTE